ncbi:MAG: hypothetical protein F6K40_10425 [Okeania sp. SIO3I5]|uniref:hypothetical protein n=1 Tax=Okeania sp. SIO3I5 TaxID=2607805 RepID=UPI0013BAAFEE|nr:hypothetical protein [Okeania sp. SIO3I5]NEQ36668.1 hypothetical protein [Okeania sp. SIO3I5]
MVGMYTATQGGSTFSFKATDPDEGVRLTAVWSTIVYNSGDDRWPPTTDQPKIYNFELCYAYKPLMEFEWLDYRGGSMLDLSSDDNVRILKDYAAQSNGFFFCISGKYLRDPVTEANLQEIAVDSQANLMSNYLQDLNLNSTRPDQNKSFPIVIIVTMYDYCYHRDKRELIEDVKKIFPPLFASNSGWLVMICPVTLGKELAQNSDNGKIEPKNLDVPVAFVLYSILTEQVQIQQEKLREIEDRLDDLESSNRVNQWINRAEIKKLNKSFEQADMQFKKTIEMINILAREQDLSSTDIYLSGKRIQIDLN